MYVPVNRLDPKETVGRCLDYHNEDGVYLPCMDAIEKGYCYKKRTTPVL
jgi:hypothetical protein